MIRIMIYLIAAVGSAALLPFAQDATTIGLLTGISTALLIPIIDMWVSHPYGWDLIRNSVLLRRTDVRVSVSYLLRIERDGKYLLIRGTRYPDQFQPVGGVYKFNPSALDQFRDWNLRSDDFVRIDDVSRDDLRVRIPGRYLLSFMRWFDSGRNREIGPFREYFEELVGDAGLDPEMLSTVRFDLRRRHVHKIRYSDYAQSKELLVADIFDLVCGPDYLQRLLSVTEQMPKQFKWVTAEQIRRLGAEPGSIQQFKIAQTAQWTL